MLGPQLGFTHRERSLREGLRLLVLPLLVREASRLVKHMCGFRMLGSYLLIIDVQCPPVVLSKRLRKELAA